MTGTLLFEDYTHGVYSFRNITGFTAGLNCREIEENKDE